MTLTGNFFRRNRKADIPNLIYFVVIIFLVAIAGVIGWTLMKAFNTQIQGSSQISAQGQTIMSSLKGRYVVVIDSSFLITLIGLIIAMAVGSWFIYTHPAFFWISIPIFAFIVFFAAIFGNAFFNIKQTMTDANDFPILTFVMNNYVVFIVVAIVIVAVTLFAKTIRPQE